MLIRYADWKKPTDDAYAFRLRAADSFGPVRPPPGTVSEVGELAREVMEPGEAERFAARVKRWSGPEDAGPHGDRPYEGAQVGFLEGGARERLTARDVDGVMRGRVLVLEGDGQTDSVLRDHHMLDVALYHYRTRGELPLALFHADRHSDWCRDGYLAARAPFQAASWWKLFDGLKRPGGRPVLREEEVHFATARPERNAKLSGRDVEPEVAAPGAPRPEELLWANVLARPELARVDWVSLDLDYFQPFSQLRLSRGLLRDARFHGLLARARVRVFVLSPQFTNGGDRIEPWETQGSLGSSLRLVNWLRAQPAGSLRPRQTK